MLAAKAKSARGLGGGDSVHERHPRLPKTKGGFCVSTVSIVSGCDLSERARADEFGATVADIIGGHRLRTKMVAHGRRRC
jgi:hypothetical protein